MNAILDPFKALWRRKLWPAAVLLVGALVAVPTVLAKNPEPAPAPAPVAAKTGDDISTAYVAAPETTDAAARRRVLGAEKDPFMPAALSPKIKAERAKARAKAKKEAAAAKAALKTAAAKQSSGGTSSGSGATAGSGSGSGAGSGTGSTPPAAAPPAGEAPKSYPKYSIKVAFGKVEDDAQLETQTVQRLAVLPSADAPVLVYRGVEDGGKVAIFELTGTVVAQGDGKCEPSPTDCQILKLKAGETEFLTVSDTGTDADAQYELDLKKIYAKQTSSSASLTKAGSAGLALLKHLASGRKPSYVFSAETGTLHKVARGHKLTKAAQRASL